MSRPRIKKGTLVYSTNPTDYILSKRLVVSVYFTNSYKSVKRVAEKTRNCLLD
jgi:hypothetical protein